MPDMKDLVTMDFNFDFADGHVNFLTNKIWAFVPPDGKRYEFDLDEYTHFKGNLEAFLRFKLEKEVV